MQDIEVHFRSSIVDDFVVYEIDKNTSAADVALGKLSEVIRSLYDEQQIKTLQDSITRAASGFGAETIFATLYDWKLSNQAKDPIPEILGTQQMVIFDTPVTADKHYMEWHVPTEQFATIIQTVAPLVLLDASGEVITTRPVGLYIPRVRE